MCLTLHKIYKTLITDRDLLQATFTTIDGGYLFLPVLHWETKPPSTPTSVKFSA